MDRLRSSARDAAASIPWDAAAMGLPLLVYLRTLAPTIYGLDSAELTTGAAVLGIVHAPGSPTYLLLAHLFTYLPFGDVGYRVNLLSAVAAAVAVLFLFRTITLLCGRRLDALAASWFLAFTYYYWITAVAAELYALHAAFVTAILFLLVGWRRGTAGANLVVAATLFGLGMGNHLAMSLLAPGFVYLALSGSGHRRLTPYTLAGVLLGAALGAAVYLYLPIRFLSDAPLNYARDYWQVDLASIDGLAWMISARMFEGAIFGVPYEGLTSEAWNALTWLSSNFVGIGLVLGVMGLVEGFARDRSEHLGLVLLFAGHTVFYVSYSVGDKELMLAPAYLIWAIWVALGAQFAAKLLNRHLPSTWTVSSPSLLLFIAFGALVFNYPRADLSDDWSARVRGEAILGYLPPQALYLGTWADVPILEFLQIVEGQRTDVEAVNLFFARGRGASLAANAAAEGRPVYASRPALVRRKGLDFEEIEACDCYRVVVAPPPG